MHQKRGRNRLSRGRMQRYDFVELTDIDLRPERHGTRPGCRGLSLKAHAGTREGEAHPLSPRLFRTTKQQPRSPTPTARPFASPAEPAGSQPRPSTTFMGRVLSDVAERQTIVRAADTLYHSSGRDDFTALRPWPYDQSYGSTSMHYPTGKTHLLRHPRPPGRPCARIRVLRRRSFRRKSGTPFWCRSTCPA